MIDVDLALAETVDANRLLVGVGRQPVVEHAGAGAERQLAALARRPRRAEARTEVVVVVEVRLRLVADAGAEREVLADADVVLEIPAGLKVVVADVRVAHPLRVAARRAREERVEALEGVGAEIV